MNVWPNASDQTEHFRFESGDCLYRDHRGHRVLADWEGPGTVHLIRSDVSFQINGLANGGVLFPFSFGDFATITAIEEGTFEAVVTRNLGLQYAELDDPIIIPNEEFGVNEFHLVPQELTWLWLCGYVLDSPDPIRIDDVKRFGRIVGGIPIPFFQCCESRVGLKAAVHFDFHARELDFILVADPDSQPARNWKSQNLSAPEAMNSQFEDGTEHIGYVSSLLNACCFDVQLPANCIGIRISKTYDQFHGRQCARVWCDDDFKGLWYLPRQNRVQRWAKAWFGFDIEPISNERIVRIAMDPPGGTPMWSMSEITVVGLILNPNVVEC